MTREYEFIKQFDSLAAEIYNDKKYYFLTTGEIARLRHMAKCDVSDSYKRAKDILKNPDDAWLCGLSPRAKNIIKNRTPYTEFKQLYSDVMNEKIDIECLPKAGHKVACEIRRWCVFHS